jgi:hypothetical protein
MLNIGLIGDIKVLNTYIESIRKNANLHISGKSSIGTRIHRDDSMISIPEFNRIELIERSDILLINHFSLLPFHLVQKLIKKGKHIFATDYPEFEIKECDELVKLAEEAGISFHISNPLFNFPAIQWLKDNIKAPAFFDISYFINNSDNNNTLIKLLLMTEGITRLSPKKIEALSFQSGSNQTDFNNLRFDYSSSTVINLNFGKKYSDEFFVKAYASGKIVFLDLIVNTFIYNNTKINLTSYYPKDEFNTFIDNILHKKVPATGIANYLAAIYTLEQVKAKLSQFSYD